MFLSYKSLIEEITRSVRKHELMFFILFIIQIGILPSMPSESKSMYSDEWIGYISSSVFELIFYPLFFYSFYNKKRSSFVKEVVAFSVIARIHSFLIIGILSIVQMTIWKIAKDQKIPHASLVFYIQYIVLFMFIMIHIKKKELKINSLS